MYSYIHKYLKQNNKMDKIKIIKTQEKELKDLNLKLVDLKVSDSQDNDYFFLEDNLKERLKALLEENKIKGNVDKVYYSLSNCQGDGFMFEGMFEYKGCLFKINHVGYYYHENSKSIEVISYKGKYDWYNLNDKTSKKVEIIEEEFNTLYVGICKKIRDLGYDIISEEDEDQILRNGFRRFLEENDINEMELYEFNYSNKEKEGFIKVCNSGDTCISGLWIENFKVKVEDKIKVSCDIVEYQNIEVLK